MKNTSANIVLEFANEINELSIATGVSKSNIVLKLLKYILKRINTIQVQDILTEYQRGEGIQYKKIDYVPSTDLINELGHFRWVYRISISKLICASFILFWDDIVAQCYEIENKNDRVKLWDNILRNYEQLIQIFQQFHSYSIL